MENEAGEAGTKIPDWTTDAFLGTLAIAWLEAHYSAWDAPGQFGWDIHPGGHEINGRKSVDWLHRKLAGGAVQG